MLSECSRTITEQNETLHRRDTRRIFRAVRESTASLNYEDEDIEEAASILSEDPSVSLDVDPIILRSKIYRKYHPVRYQRMIANFPSRTNTTSTLKAPRGSRHARTRSANDDPLLAQVNVSLPFLGIPFQGELAPDLGSESEPEPEDPTIHQIAQEESTKNHDPLASDSAHQEQATRQQNPAAEATETVTLDRSELHQSDKLHNPQPSDTPEPTSTGELDPSILAHDSPPHRPLSFPEDSTISTEPLAPVDTVQTISDQKSDQLSEHSWHASDVSNLYSDSEDDQDKANLKTVPSKSAITANEPIAREQIDMEPRNMDSVSAELSKVSQGALVQEQTSSRPLSFQRGVEELSRPSDASKLAFTPGHPGLSLDLESDRLLDIITSAVPGFRSSDSLESGSDRYDGTDDDAGRDIKQVTGMNRQKDADVDPRKQDRATTYLSDKQSIAKVQERFNSLQPDSTTPNPEEEGLSLNVSDTQPVGTPTLRLDEVKSAEALSPVKTTTTDRRVSTPSIPSFSYKEHDSNTSLKSPSLPTRSSTVKDDGRQQPPPPPSPRRAPRPVPPKGQSRLSSSKRVDKESSSDVNISLESIAGIVRSRLSARRPQPPPITGSSPGPLSSNPSLSKENSLSPQHEPYDSPLPTPKSPIKPPTFDDILGPEEKPDLPASPFSRSSPSIRSEITESVGESVNSTMSSNEQDTFETRATTISGNSKSVPAQRTDASGLTKDAFSPDPRLLNISSSLGILAEKQKLERSSKRISKGISSLMGLKLMGSNERMTRLTKLHEAAERGHLTSLRNALVALDKTTAVQTPIVLPSESTPRTPLMRAAAGGHVACLEELAAYGIDCNAIDKTGRTALHYALTAQKSEAALWLLYYQKGLKRNPSTNQATRSDTSLLGIADKDGVLPVHLAAGLDQTETLDAFINEGVDFLARDGVGRTPLHFAIQKQSLDCVKYLSERMSNLDESDNNGETPLMLAAKVNGQNSARLLLDQGADKYKKDSDGDHPIHHAARTGHLTILEMLFLSLDDLEVKNNRAERPLHLACANNHTRVVRAILRVPGIQVNPFTDPPHLKSNAKSKADMVEVSRNLASTPLHYACRFGFYDIANLLIQNGAMVNGNQEDGVSPLMLACNANSPGIAELLLVNGANPNSATSKERMTALHISVRRNDLETTKILVSLGANTRATLNNRYLESPAGLAIRENPQTKRDAVNYVLRYNMQTLNPALRNTSAAGATQSSTRRLGPQGTAYAGPYATGGQTYNYVNLAAESARAPDSEFREFFNPPSASAASPPSYAESQAQVRGSSQNQSKR